MDALRFCLVEVALFISLLSSSRMTIVPGWVVNEIEDVGDVFS